MEEPEAGLPEADGAVPADLDEESDGDDAGLESPDGVEPEAVESEAEDSVDEVVDEPDPSPPEGFEVVDRLSVL